MINGSSTVQFEKSANVLQSVTIQPIVNLENIKPQIPSESEVDAYPIVLIFNGYDMNKALNDEVYVNTVEVRSSNCKQSTMIRHELSTDGSSSHMLRIWQCEDNSTLSGLE